MSGIAPRRNMVNQKRTKQSMNEGPPIDAEILPESTAVAKRDPLMPPPAPQAMTPAQARIEAVADLTKTALAKAATLKLSQEETNLLIADFPDEAFKPGAAGKENLLYIEHAALRDRLNTVLGLGQWAVIVRETWNEPFKTQAGKDAVRVYARGMLLVRGAYVGEAVGEMEYFPHNAGQNYGDAFEGAKTAAFRRCAKEFGIGLQAWRKDWGDGWWARKRAQGNSGASKPTTQPQTRPAPQTAPESKPASTVKASGAAEDKRPEWKAWMIGQLLPVKDAALAYAIDKAVIMPNEGLEDWPLDQVVTSKEGMASLLAAIKGNPTDRNDPDHRNHPLIVNDTRPKMEGVIRHVTLKEGKKVSGEPWSLWGIKLDTGNGEVWLNSFSNTVGQAATALKGQIAVIAYSEDEKGKTALEVRRPGEKDDVKF